MPLASLLCSKGNRNKQNLFKINNETKFQPTGTFQISKHLKLWRSQPCFCKMLIKPFQNSKKRFNKTTMNPNRPQIDPSSPTNIKTNPHKILRHVKLLLFSSASYLFSLKNRPFLCLLNRSSHVLPQRQRCL